MNHLKYKLTGLKVRPRKLGAAGYVAVLFYELGGEETFKILFGGETRKKVLDLIEELKSLPIEQIQ